MRINESNASIKKIEDDIKQRINIEIAEIKTELRQKTNNEETVKVWKHFSKYAEY